MAAIIDYIENFEYVPGETPLTDYQVPLAIGAGYLMSVFILKRFMANREKIEARLLSIVHNFNMLAISVICFFGIGYGIFDILRKNGLSNGVEQLFCDQSQTSIWKGPLYFWVYVFYLSKFYELIDTGLILIRKSNLIFLHVYHHWVTMLLCIVSLNTAIPYQWGPTGLNALVHIPMYYYYLMAILKKNVWWKKYITQMQIIQFVLDSTTCIVSYIWNSKISDSGETCSSWNVPWANPIALSIIFSYLLLFVQFYTKSNSRAPAPKSKSS